MKQSKINFNYVAYGSLGLLGILLAALILPISSRSASASPLTAQATTMASWSVESVVSIALDNILKLDITPKSNGSFSVGTIGVDVATNNTTGYSLYLQATNPDGKLHAIDKSNTSTIDPVPATLNSTNFSSPENLNTWGYANTTGISAETANYTAIPTTSNQPFLTTDQMNTKDHHEISFGASISTALPADTYRTSIIVSAIANPIEITNLTQLTYLQDMTPDICANTQDYVNKDDYIEKRLIDYRDGNSYYVAKLADGNCWMTQNLHLNFAPTTIPLTPNTSDVVSDVELPSTGAGYWQLSHGRLVLTHPSTYSPCTGTEECLNTKTLTQIDPDTWTIKEASEITATLGTDVYTAADPASKTYDPHYLIGNYYQYNYATANSGTDLTYNTAPYSICPKGWQLPATNDTAEKLDPKSFRNLLTPYDLTTNLTGTGPGNETYNITMKPLYFAATGLVANTGVLNMTVGAGYLTSSYAMEATTSAKFRFNLNSYTPIINFASDDAARSTGYFPVRCLAR